MIIIKRIDSSHFRIKQDCALNLVQRMRDFNLDRDALGCCNFWYDCPAAIIFRWDAEHGIGHWCRTHPGM